MSIKKTICFVTSAHLAHNPRLIKEAIAAEDAGYKVRIVAVASYAWADEFTKKILKKKPTWEYTCIDISRTGFKPWFLKYCVKLRQLGLRFLFDRGLKEVGPYTCQLYFELLTAALKAPADLFIGHNLPALPVVYQASKKQGKPFGFDLEDAYSLIKVNNLEEIDSLEQWIENRFLKDAVYLTAASPGIADHYKKTYPVPRPNVILNVFPLDNEQEILVNERLKLKCSGNVKLYWFSQVIGLDRGLQDVLKALSELNDLPVELHLRGTCEQDVKDELIRIIGPSRIASHLYFHPQIPASKLSSQAIEYDIGLATETLTPINRKICITNKIFSYMKAGLAVIATRTTGQIFVMDQAPGAGFCYTPGNIDELRRIIKALVTDKQLLGKCKKESLRAARDKFNWEMESKKFLALIKEVIE